MTSVDPHCVRSLSIPEFSLTLGLRASRVEEGVLEQGVIRVIYVFGTFKIADVSGAQESLYPAKDASKHLELHLLGVVIGDRCLAACFTVM